MEQDILYQIKQKLGRGEATEAGRQLLAYAQQYQPEAEDEAFLLLKEIETYEKELNQGLGPDAAVKRKAEKGMLDLIRRFENPTTEPDSVRLLRETKRSESEVLLWLRSLLSKPLVWGIILLPIIGYQLGKMHARQVNARVSEQIFYQAVVNKNLQLKPYEQGEGFSLLYDCSGTATYTYDPGQGLIKKPHLLSDPSAWMSGEVLSAAPVEAYAVGSALTLYVASPASFQQFFKLLRQGQGNTLQRVLLFAAAGCGYLYGYHTYIRKEPACSNPSLQAYLNNEDFWKSLYHMQYNVRQVSRQLIETGGKQGKR